MSIEQSPQTGPSDDSRLVYGWSGGRRHGPRRTALAVATARGIDQAMGALHLTRPAVLVSGFWRSGTTWLQECLTTALGGKAVFEPLAPMEPLRRAALMRLHPDDGEDLCQATIPGPQDPDDPFWAYLDRTCTGRLATPYLLSCRRHVAESFRRAIVVKDVRLQANLAGFHRRYGTPVIHVRRHPCAVVASLKAADWHWSFARAPLSTLLPRLAPVLPREDMAAALRFDTDGLSRTAAFWAVTERLAAMALDGQPWGTLVSYELFAAHPHAVLAQVCGSLGLRMLRPVDFAAPSASVAPEAFASYGAAPSDRWRQLLSDPEVRRIEEAVDTLHPGWRAAFEDASIGTGETMSSPPAAARKPPRRNA